jgi:hypothetical protein
MSDQGEVVLNGVKEAAETIKAVAEAIQIVGDLLNDAERSVVLELDNTSTRRLTLQEVNSEHGGFRTPIPPQSVNPVSSVLFAHASEGFLTGTEGWVKFRIDDEGTTFHLQWVNPFLGGNESSCRVEGTHTDWYVTHTFSGGGNKAAHQRFLLGERAAFNPRQSDWRTCGKCKVLFSGFDQGICPANPIDTGAVDGSGNPVFLLGAHEAAGDTFQLSYGIPGPSREAEWRKCGQCKVLFYNGNDTKGVCPGRPLAGPPGLPPFHPQSSPIGHVVEANSPEFLLVFDMPPRPEQQRDWRVCKKCLGLFFLPHNADGDCPAGGIHDPTHLNYVLDRA